MRIAHTNNKSLNLLFKHVLAYTGYSETELKGKRRFTELVLARSLFCYIARERRIATLPNLGRYLNRHHTSIMNMVFSIEGYLTYDAKTIRYVDRFKKYLDENDL